MSLPTLAKVYKNDQVVAIAFCNAGWWIDSNGLYRCIKTALETISDYFKVPDGETRKLYDERYPGSFGKIEDIVPFDYIQIYEFQIPFALAMQVFFTKVTVDEFEKICVDTGIIKGKQK